MKTIAKLALGALALASVGAVAATPADAAVGFSFGVGPGPGYYRGYYGPVYGPGYYAPDPCLGPYAYRPYYCGYPIYGGQVFIDGNWYRGPLRYRYSRGRPEFFFRGGWRGGRFGDRRR